MSTSFRDILTDCTHDPTPVGLARASAGFGLKFVSINGPFVSGPQATTGRRRAQYVSILELLCLLLLFPRLLMDCGQNSARCATCLLCSSSPSRLLERRHVRHIVVLRRIRLSLHNVPTLQLPVHPVLSIPGTTVHWPGSLFQA